MIDQFGRLINYARISITQQCNLRCLYCVSPFETDSPKSCNILSDDNIIRICKILSKLGIHSIKITGGEPLMRPDVAKLVKSIKAIPGIEHVSMTTNGVFLERFADELKSGGLDSINISLNTLDHNIYRMITKTGHLNNALAGIERAISAGFDSMKINCVPLGDINEGDLIDIASKAKHHNIHVRFIELMPIGPGQKLKRLETLRIKEMLTTHYGEMTAHAGKLGNGPANYYTLNGFLGGIGFISPISDCFCKTCNRIRIAADGTLKTCLYARGELNLADELDKNDDAGIAMKILHHLWSKPARHKFLCDENAKENLPLMVEIGG